MGIYYWIRVIIMIGVFAAVVIIMRQLDTPRSPSPGFLSFFTGDDDSSSRYTMCPTRVSRVEVASGQVVFEEDMRWYSMKQGKEKEIVELDPVAVEKWFGLNCKVKGEPATEPGGEFQTVAQFSFVSGTPQALLRAPSGEFQWNGSTFHSSQLEEALDRLLNLPIRRIPARVNFKTTEGEKE
ncbi:MAG: hypothetical protein AB7G93_11365 [Bdellovibrionales bacterium]